MPAPLPAKRNKRSVSPSEAMAVKGPSRGVSRHAVDATEVELDLTEFAGCYVKIGVTGADVIGAFVDTAGTALTGVSANQTTIAEAHAQSYPKGNPQQEIVPSDRPIFRFRRCPDDTASTARVRVTRA